jgi:hypothetical protein
VPGGRRTLSAGVVVVGAEGGVANGAAPLGAEVPPVDTESLPCRPDSSARRETTPYAGRIDGQNRRS